jgi:hypothetical protein
MGMKKMILMGVLLFSFPGLWTNPAYGADPLPENFPGITVTTYDPAKVGEGYIFLAVASETPGIGTYLMIFQNDGTPVWYREVDSEEIYDFKVLPNGYLSYAPFIEAHSFAGGGDVVHEILDPDYNLQETITGGNGYVAEGHDFQILPNGHVLQFGYYRSQVDMSQIVSGGHPAALVAGAVVQELDSQRNVIFQWRTWDQTTFEDYFSGILTDPNIKKPVINGWHLNTINLDIDGHILVATPQSGANLPVTSGWVKKINRQTGETLWHLGGTENQFTFVGVTTAEGLQAFSGHACHRLENGNFLVYDNGNTQNTRKSKVYEFTLDEVNKVATYVWSYVPSAMISGHHRGSAQRLSNGNTFIGWGGAAGRDIPACTEVDPSGQVVYELKFNNLKVESYRAFRFLWPPIQKIEHTEYELTTGNTYAFGDTGVTLEVIDRTGDGYNEATVTREPYAPVNPLFPGKAPQVLPVRVKIDRSGIQSMTANMFFDAESFGFKAPAGLTVYHREFPGQGLFLPLPMEAYNPVTHQVRSRMDRFGEFIFAYPDVADMPFVPMLIEPESDRGVQAHEVIAAKLAKSGVTYAVNQTRPISLSWSPKGMARSYAMQIATDADFTTVVVDESWMTEARYLFTTATPNTTYFYRVNTTNEGGTSEWASGSFATVPPMIQVTVPNGGQAWKRGLSYFVQWDDNLSEDVVLELYKADALVKTIATTPSTGAYNWAIDLDLQPGCDYSIQVKSSTNAALFDRSDKPFHLDVAVVPGDFNCDGCVGPDDLAVMANDWLKEQAGLPADLDNSGRVDLDDFAILAENWMNSCL